MKLARLIVLFALSCGALAIADDAQDTLVDEWDRVSDFDARQALTDILGLKKATSREALQHLELLLVEKPEDFKTHLLMIKVLLQKKDYTRALQLFKKLETLTPPTPQSLSELALLTLEMGNVVKAQELFARVEEQNESLLISYASALQIWGDYPQAQCIYRKYLRDYPAKVDVWRSLANALQGEGRFAEAEQIYMQLLGEKWLPPVIMDWARMKKVEKDFQAAYELVLRLDYFGSEQEEAFVLKAEVLEKMELIDEAIETYLRIALAQTDPALNADYILRAYRLYVKEGCCEAAEELLRRAAVLAPESIGVRYYQGVNLADVIEEAASPQELMEWANYYLDDECVDAAIALYQAALCLDPNYYYAQRGLAGLLPIQFRYEEAVQIYMGLLRTFPDNPTYLLEHARLRSWDKQYAEALLLYDLLIRKYPDNPRLYIEKARVAMWAQNGRLAMNTYNCLLRDAVDSHLLSLLDPSLSIETISLLMKHLEQRSIYGGVDEVADCLEVRKKILEGEPCGPIERAILSLWAEYRIQKSTYLEMKAAMAAWEGHFFESLCFMRRLIALEPGNQEALFNYAEAWCSLGLCGHSQCLFHKIRRLDPLHSVVNLALMRREWLNTPAALMDYSLWNEVGRGDLSGITRHYFKWGVENTICCPTKVRLTYDLLIDHSYINNHNFIAHGLTVNYRDTYNKHLAAEGWLTRKFHGNYSIHGPWLWNARLTIRPADGLQWVFGTERRDEFYNYFGVFNGTQSTSLFTLAKCDLSRLLTIEAGAQYLHYSDHNQQNMAQLGVSYKLTEYPRVLRFLFQGEYRTFQNMDEFIYADDNLVNIIHPYWTPQHYLAGRVGFEFYHDLTCLPFCGAEKKYYIVNCMAVEDTQDNPGISVALEIHWEWANRWSFVFSGVVNRTRQWYGEGLKTALMFRF